MSPADFLISLYAAYPQDAELCLEVRPLLPEWRKEDMTYDDVRAVHSSVRRWYAIAPEYLCKAAKYAEGYKDTFDCYFGVLPRIGRGGTQADVYGAGCLFCDVDGGEDGIAGSVALIKASGVPKPTLAVVSGGGLHCYWLLPEFVRFDSHAERETYKSVLQRLVRKIGGESPAAHADMSAADCARILRVPGTLNHKRQDEPRQVKIVHFPRNQDGSSVTAYHSDSTSLLNPLLTYDEWRGLLPREPVEKIKEKRPYSSYDEIGAIADGLKRWAAQGYPQGKRHQDLSGAAAWLIRDCNLAEQDAERLLMMKAQNSPGVRQITEREITDMIRWAARR